MPLVLEDAQCFVQVVAEEVLLDETDDGLLSGIKLEFVQEVVVVEHLALWR